MPAVPLDLEQLRQNDDLFNMWQEELSLRYAARAFPAEAGAVSDAFELEYYYRSWYFSRHRLDFFNLLLDHLHNIEILKWLAEGPDHLLREFWDFLPWYIMLRSPRPFRLQFLVNLYNPEHHLHMTRVINALDLDSCQYLASRTANPELRKLFKERETELINTRKRDLYGYNPQLKSASNPGLYGDKTENILEALDLLEQSNASHFRDPYAMKRFSTQLAAAESLFRSGMIEDCLTLLMDIYSDYQRNNRLVSLLDDETIHRSFSRLLRQVIPLQALLSQPVNPYRSAHKLYADFFPLINPDRASLQYLAIGESIAAAFNQPHSAIRYEIHSKGSILKQYRPYEASLLNDSEVQAKINPDRVETLLKMTSQKISSLPHESFVIMEYLRLSNIVGLLDLNHHLASALIDYYLLLWEWVPHPMFINETTSRQLASIAGESKRQRAIQICNLNANYDRSGLQGEMASRPELVRMKDAELKRQVLAGYFLGVIE